MAIIDSRNMKGTLKPFDAQEHEIYDSKGKKAFISTLRRNLPRFLHIENPNQYGIDLLSLNNQNEVVYGWEIEVRYGNWPNDTPFPFHAINCIERKDYLWRHDQELWNKIPYKPAPNPHMFYVQLNKPCTRAVVIDDKTILQYEPIPWDNRKAKGEYVRQVPIDRTVQLSLPYV